MHEPNKKIYTLYWQQFKTDQLHLVTGTINIQKVELAK